MLNTPVLRDWQSERTFSADQCDQAEHGHLQAATGNL
jgi:hypothetical protein